jgi:hypothetical protein
MTHLILHKVRGEPAFDIAEKLQIGDEEGWIIPTSGHRAYPYANVPLSALANGGLDSGFMDLAKWKIPEDWPDHYTVDKGQAPSPSFNIMSIISPMMTKIKRRL